MTVQRESPLSNGAFSHQHRPHCVCSAREHSGGSAGTRERRGEVLPHQGSKLGSK